MARGRAVTAETRMLFERHAEMCKVFSDATRLMILNVLREGELSVTAISEKVGIPLGTVSPHLLMMRRRRVLLSRRDGNQVLYRLANPKMLRAFDLIREILYEQMKAEGVLAKELEPGRARR